MDVTLLSVSLIRFSKLNLTTFTNLALARDEDNLLAGQYVRRGIQNLPSGHQNVRLKEIVLNHDSTEGSFCQDVLSDSPLSSDGTIGQRTGVDIMIDVTSKPSVTGEAMASAIVKSVARKFGIPTVSTTNSLGVVEPAWSKLDTSEKEWLLTMKPPGDTIPAIIKDMVIEHNMSTVAIFYDDTFDLDAKYTSILEPTYARYIIRKIPTNDVRGFLQDIRKAQIVNYFVLGSVPTINKILESVNVHFFFSSFFSFFWARHSNSSFASFAG